MYLLRCHAGEEEEYLEKAMDSVKRSSHLLDQLL